MGHHETTHDETRARRGAALPVALLIIVIVSVLAASAFTMLGSERRVADNTNAQLDAYTLARGGLERFVVSRASLGFTAEPPAAVESTTIALPGGYAEVVMRQVKQPQGTAVPAVYVIRSRGVRTLGATTTIAAERTVAEYAAFDYGAPRVAAAWTAISGLSINGSSATISGYDGCSASPAIGAVAVPNGGYDGSSSVPTGVPNVVYLGTAAQTPAAVEVDWNGIVNGSAMPPDITVTGSTGWPTSSDWSNPNFWPVIRANGNLDLPSDGRGTLIVTGNFNAQWLAAVAWTHPRRWRAHVERKQHGERRRDRRPQRQARPDRGASDLGNGNKTYQLQLL